MSLDEAAAEAQRRKRRLRRRRERESNEGGSPFVMSVPRAGKLYLNLGRNASYSAAASGVIPVIRIGKTLRVPVRAMERLLDAAGQTEPNERHSNQK
jgi:hypothetical protein